MSECCEYIFIWLISFNILVSILYFKRIVVSELTIDIERYLDGERENNISPFVVTCTFKVKDIASIATASEAASTTATTKAHQ